LLTTIRSELGAARTRALLLLTGVAALGVGAFSALGYASPQATAAQAQYGPVNTVAPTISGSAVENQKLTANEGTWTGDGPIKFAYQWRQCDAGGNKCSDLSKATSKTYTLQTADIGHTIRVVVTASDKDGKTSVTSGQTGVIASSGPAGAIKLSNGETSIPITSVALPERLVISDIQFSPNPVRSRSQVVTLRVKVKDTRGYVVRGALVFARSTPVVSSTPPEQLTQQDGWVTLTTVPQTDWPRRSDYNVQFFVRARKNGDDTLAGVSTRRLVQVGIG
jgi:hypothetical protein